MQIAYVTSLRLPNERGISYAIVAMCRALARTGNTVELIAPNCRVDPSKPGESIWKYHQIKPNSFIFTKLPFLDLSIPHVFYLFLKWSFSVSTIFYLLRIRPDIVHIQNDIRELLLFLKIVSPVYHPKVIFELHILPDGFYETLLERTLFARIDVLLVTTHRFAKYYEMNKFPRKKILIFPNGIDIDEFDFKTSKATLRKSLNLPEKSFIVGYGGRFVTLGMEKGTPELIQATKNLVKKYPLVLVCVGGPDQYVQKYKQLAIKSGLSSQQAIFLGDVPRTTLYKYMRTFDACVMAFPWTIHFAYNMSPLKMFEYMASKNPIIATSLPSIREVVTNNETAILIKPNDVTELTSAIKTLITQKRFGRKISDQAFREVTEKYSWKKRAETVIARVSI